MSLVTTAVDPPVQIVQNLLSDNAFESLRRYVLHSARHNGQYEEMFHRTIIKSPMALMDMHRQLALFASELSGQELKPSYNIVANYLPDGKCPLHVDRDQCLYTIDLLIAQEADDPWPLMIGEHWTDEQWDHHGYKDIERYTGDPNPEDLDIDWAKVSLLPNHAACYSGSHSWHYRPTLSQGRTDLVFFHFVREDFDGELD